MYGWRRRILGAIVANGLFRIALCYELFTPHLTTKLHSLIFLALQGAQVIAKGLDISYHACTTSRADPPRIASNLFGHTKHAALTTIPSLAFYALPASCGIRSHGTVVSW